MSTLSGDAITARVPARAEFVHILRSVAANVAARMNLTFDAVDDLRIAVDEACAQLLRAAPRSTEFTMVIEALPGSVEVVIGVSDDGAPWPPVGLERSLAWQVLSRLADGVTFDRSEDRICVRIHKRALSGATER